MTIFAMAMRRRSAFALCREHGLSVGEIAPVLGVTEEHFYKGLVRDGLSFTEMSQENRQLRAVRKIMELLRQELETLSALKDEISSKARLDALALLARTIDKVSDLQERFAADRARSASGLSADELRAVLKRIDERINELADKRAGELGSKESERAGNGGGESGMDVSGPHEAASAGE